MIRALPEFTAWLDGLTDVTLRGIVAARLKRLQLGLMGDVEPVGEMESPNCASTSGLVGAST